MRLLMQVPCCPGLLNPLHNMYHSQSYACNSGCPFKVAVNNLPAMDVRCWSTCVAFWWPPQGHLDKEELGAEDCVPNSIGALATTTAALTTNHC